jgi:site-specific DNA-methyltransferase (adenine-specific)
VNVVHNIDCMIGMSEYPDKCFDLAVVDPPYGIIRSGHNGVKAKNSKHNWKSHTWKDWDNQRPNQTYWNELFRISKNQIIWGANYFTSFLQPSMGWIFWDKGQDLSMSDGELAYTSFNRALRRIKINRNQLILDGGTIHPTQKPVKLYDWIFTKYAENGMKILDTHVGSGSSRIAAHKHKLDFIGYELDEEYWNAQEKRFAQYKSQLTLW